MRKKVIVFLLFIMILTTGVVGLIFKPFVFSGENIDKPPRVEEEQESEPIKEPIIEEETVTNLKLLATGDIMFHLPQINAAKNEDGTFDFSPPFTYVKKYIENADIAIANFETVTAGNELEFTGFPRFNSPKETLLGIKNAGFDILSTANNHSLDRGKKGIINTINAINEYGLKNIGTFKEEPTSILIEEINGIKIGFVAYTATVNGLDSLLSTEDTYMINRLDEKLIEEDINELKNQNVDIIVAYLHWGYEYYKEPVPYQIELGQKMVEWGANIILGSHPHVIQKSEIIEHDGRDNLIVYSMGNFLSNQRYDTMGNSYTEDGIMIEIELEKDIKANKTIIKKVNYIPTWIYKYKDVNGYHYEILPTEDILMNSTQFSLSESVLKRIEKSHHDTINAINFINKEVK